MPTEGAQLRSGSLRAAHRALEAELEELRATPATDRPKATSLFGPVARKLGEHLSFEEAEVLPGYEAAGGRHRRVGERAREEHRRIRDVLRRIGRGFEEGADRSPDLESELVYLLWSHVSREEEEVFPWLDSLPKTPRRSPARSARRRPASSQS